MKGQPGGSQSWSRQQPGYNDLQLYQQQLMYKQLQEFQRQQQFHHVDQETWQQSSPNHLSSLSKQASLDQLTPVVNGMPICEAPKYAWQSENTAGNMNWTQSVGPPSAHRLSNGVAYPQDQGQILQSTGHSSQQVDHYLYGTPVSGNKTQPSQFSNFQVVSNESSDSLPRSVGNQLEKPAQFATVNSFQNEHSMFQGQMILQDDPAVIQRLPGKASFYQLPVQNVRGGNMSENFDQLNAFGRNIQAQDFRGSQERADWSGSTNEKQAQEMVKLDATEQRILFSGDDDTPWDGQFGVRNTDPGGMYRNLLDGNNGFNVFPSLQSGSWSALMQSAVAEASSSDNGLQQEWNGLSLQQKELSPGNNSPAFVDYGKQQTSLMENLQSEPSMPTRPFLLFDGLDASSHEQASSFLNQSALKSVYHRDDELNADISHQCLQQSSKDAASQVDKSELHSQFHASHESQMHFGDASTGAWTGLLCEQSASSVPMEARPIPPNTQGSWAHQQHTQSYSVGSYNRMNGWRENEPSGDAVLKVQDRESPLQQLHARSPAGSLHIRKDNDAHIRKTDGSDKPALSSHLSGGFNLTNSEASGPRLQTGNLHTGSFSGINLYNSKSTQDVNQRSLAAHQVDYGIHASSDYSGKSKGNDDNSSHAWESPRNLSSATSAEFHDRRKEKDVQKEVPSYMSANSHSAEGVDSGILGREKAHVILGIPSRPSSSGSGREQAHVGPSTSGPGRFQFHPMGNFGDNLEPDAQKRNFYAQGMSPLTAHGLKNQGQGHIRSSQFASPSPSNNSRDADKNSFDSLGNVKGTEKGHTGVNIFGRNSNVPNSFDESTAFLAQNKSGHSSQNMLELLHKLDQSRETNSLSNNAFSNRNTMSERPNASSGPPSTQQLGSTLQGTGLHLSLPSQQHESMLSRVILDHNSRQHFDPASSLSARPLTSMHESQRETLDDTHRSSEQPSNENSYTTSITSSSSSFFPHGPQHLLQQRQQSVNMSLCNQIDTDEHAKDTLDRSSQVLSPGAANQVAASRPPSDARQALRDVNQVQPSRSSVTGFSVRPVSQPLNQPCGPQQGAFSAMLHNVWTHVSAQRQMPGNSADKLNPNLSQPVTTSPMDEQRGGQRGQSTAMGEQHMSKENSVRQILSGRADASQGGEAFSKHSVSLVQLYQQDVGRRKLDQGSQLEKQPTHSSLLNIAASGRDVSSPGQRIKPVDGQRLNYSLLQQVQAMKAMESDPSQRLGKRLKASAESAPDAQQLTGKSPQTLMYGHNHVTRVPQSPIMSDSKMLCFTTEASINDSVVGPSQVIRKEVQSHDQTRRINITSNSSPKTGLSSTPIDPQMAPSWFGQYDKLKNEQILSMYSSISDQKAAAQQRLSLPSVPNIAELSGSAAKVDDYDQGESAWRSFSAAASAAPADRHSLDSPVDAAGSDLSQKPKRRKASLSKRLPWHKEISGVSARLPSISEAEASWAHATNRLIEKQVDDESDVAEDAFLGFRARRRLILTTQLMQLLLPAVPPKILRSDSNLHYDSVTYLAARLALGGACGGADLASSSERPETPLGRDGDESSSKAAEDFITRARKMEDEISRLESTASIPDLRVECQDLERFSMINRFARFHSRGQPVGVESLPTSEAPHRRIYPQRYVAALPMPLMPANVADGLPCFSL